MTIAVLGAGVIGATTAYHLARDGHSVVVIDRQPGPGLETSFANGGQVSANQPFVWGEPGVLMEAARMMFDADSPLLIKPFRWDPQFWTWSLKFLSECTAARHDRNLDHVARIAVYSRNQLKALRQRTNIQYDAASNGILKLFRNAKAFDAAAKKTETLKAYGIAQTVLDKAGCIAAEPSLSEGDTSTIAGGILAPDEEHGDAHVFAREIAALAEAEGVKFHYNTRITGLTVAQSQITAVETDHGAVPCDAVVLALGSYGVQLAKSVGQTLPLYPIKGYSITAPVLDESATPTLSVTDEAKRVVFSRLGGRLRAAGTAEFSGYSTDLNAKRVDAIRRAGETLFPGAADFATAEAWTGLRPVTPDSRPVIGRGRIENLYFNTGHGALGWTMAAGSAQIIADLIGGRTPEIDPTGYSPTRFDK